MRTGFRGKRMNLVWGILAFKVIEGIHVELSISFENSLIVQESALCGRHI